MNQPQVISALYHLTSKKRLEEGDRAIDIGYPKNHVIYALYVEWNHGGGAGKRFPVRPNVRAKRGDDGMPPRPGWRKCTAYRRPGLGGLPLGLASSEGLGRTARPLGVGAVAHGQLFLGVKGKLALRTLTTGTVDQFSVRKVQTLAARTTETGYSPAENKESSSPDQHDRSKRKEWLFNPDQ